MADNGSLKRWAARERAAAMMATGKAFGAAKEVEKRWAVSADSVRAIVEAEKGIGVEDPAAWDDGRYQVAMERYRAAVRLREAAEELVKVVDGTTEAERRVEEIMRDGG